MSNRNFDASVVTGRLRDKNVAQQIYGAMRAGRSTGNPQTVNANASIMPEYNEGVETVVELGLGAKYSFDLGGIANYVALDEGGGGGGGPAATAPSPPRNASAAMSVAGEADVGFEEPTSDGGSPIVSYTVTSSPGGITATASASPITVPGLSNGTTYTFTVVATNAAGLTSAPSNTTTPVSYGTLQTQQFTVTGSSTWTAPTGVRSVEYLVVGGGGGGGGGHDSGGGGGGGGGMVLTGDLPVIPGNNYTVTVGANGAPSTNSYPTIRETNGGDGGISIFGSITALGGGGGKASRVQTTASGYRGSAQNSNIFAATGGSGGGSNSTSAGGSGGGGGGASANGTNGTGGSGGTGGDGIQSTFSGTNVEYGKGGAGARGNVTTIGTPGIPNTGNGGGAGGFTNTASGASNGGPGGSGMVILRYYA
jgi:hypothetical protein